MRDGRAADVRRGLGALALGLVLGACGSGSLVDHSAPVDVLHPSACPGGQVLCGAACVPEDALHCGATCASCASAVPADPNAGPVCTEAHACSFACNPGWLRVGSGCERAVAVSGGFGHTCAVTTSGQVKCWGANEHGQLGDGSTVDSAIPVDVALQGAATVAAGYVHTCALAGGAVWCWGDNTTGALGDGTTAQRSTPVQAAGVSGAVAAAAGGGENAGGTPRFYGHTCALVGVGASGGSLRCWGSNDSGQLGNGTLTQSTTAVPVALGSNDGRATAVSNGDRHTCAIVAGGVWCWGAAGSWQLGNGNNQSNQPSPVQAQGVQTGATSLAAGAAHSCATVASPTATLECWGSNSKGQAAGGDNSFGAVQRPAAVALPGLSPSAVAAGSTHTCALDGASGAVTCFGANDLAQLSGPSTATGLVAVPLPSPATALAAGYDHSCALLRDGGIVCWGANGRGQLGTGTRSPSVATPAFVSGR